MSAAMPGAVEPEPRCVIEATSPEGERFIIGPVQSRASVVELESDLMDAGWQVAGEVRYMSRAQWRARPDAPGRRPAAGLPEGEANEADSRPHRSRARRPEGEQRRRRRARGHHPRVV